MDYLCLVDQFWFRFVKNYKLINLMLINKDKNVINFCYELAGFEISSCINFEFTVGEINRIYFPDCDNINEMYISPRLLEKNVYLMELLYMRSPKINNLYIIKYYSYNTSTPLLDTFSDLLDKTELTVHYNDLGCQYNTCITDVPNVITGIPEPRLVTNIILLVKKQLADILLIKVPIKFMNPENNKIEVIEKWAPRDWRFINAFLLNIIGEYNLIYNTGFIEFLHEDDPIIAPESEFLELSSLIPEYKSYNTNMCRVCNRYDHQKKLFNCKCGVFYCSNTCQQLDINHEKYCL